MILYRGGRSASLGSESYGIVVVLVTWVLVSDDWFRQVSAESIGGEDVMRGIQCEVE